MNIESKSLSKGGFYYLVYNVLNIAFPFFTGMYVSHVLLPWDIGAVAAAQNLATYFCILAFLGIPTYGLREISKTRNDVAERSKIFSELFIINFCSTIIFFIIYLVLILSFSTYRNELTLYLVVGISIVLNLFNISWLYEGLEEFSFISVRNIIFKVISFCSLVIFVRSTEDILWYALVTVIGTAGNYIINMLYSPRFVRFTFAGLNFRRHLKSIFTLVSVNLAIELYSLVDITMMNFMCDRAEIAYYKYGQAIERILLQIINTFTIVLVPRLSFYFKEGEMKGYNRLLSKTFKLIIIVASPLIIGIYFTADFLLVELYGCRYIISARILKLLSVLLVISPIGYLLGSRVMLVTGREKLMIIPVGVGALVNIGGNAMLITNFMGYGAAIASVFSESVVMFVFIFMCCKHFKLEGVMNSVLKTFISCVFVCGYLFALEQIITHGWILLGLQFAGVIILYSALLLMMKETVAIEYYKRIMNNF